MLVSAFFTGYGLGSLTAQRGEAGSLSPGGARHRKSSARAARRVPWPRRIPKSNDRPARLLRRKATATVAMQETA